ncbi:phytanoyl-CoA dioxygenase family protein [Streptomyces tricolor]|nr:phytanoyl-CoA dioxygenase family protein [Streptomyces tricolor]
MTSTVRPRRRLGTTCYPDAHPGGRGPLPAPPPGRLAPRRRRPPVRRRTHRLRPRRLPALRGVAAGGADGGLPGGDRAADGRPRAARLGAGGAGTRRRRHPLGVRGARAERHVPRDRPLARLAGIARQILGSDVYVHQTRVNLKPAFDGSGFGWHSDFETWHSEDGMPAPRALSLSVAPDRERPVQRTVDDHPGGAPHLRAVRRRRHRPTTTGRRCGEEPARRAGGPCRGGRARPGAGHPSVHRPGGLGGGLRLQQPARLGAERLAVPAPNLFVVYNSVENAIGTPYAAPRPRPGYLASRTFTPVPRRDGDWGASRRRPREPGHHRGVLRRDVAGGGSQSVSPRRHS